MIYSYKIIHDEISSIQCPTSFSNANFLPPMFPVFLLPSQLPFPLPADISLSFSLSSCLSPSPSFSLQSLLSCSFPHSFPFYFLLDTMVCNIIQKGCHEYHCIYFQNSVLVQSYDFHLSLSYSFTDRVFVCMCQPG